MQTTVNQRLKFIRQSKGMTQEAFAKAIGTSRSMVNSIENDARGVTLELAQSACLALNVSPNWLLFGIGEVLTITDAPKIDPNHAPVNASPNASLNTDAPELAVHVAAEPQAEYENLARRADAAEARAEAAESLLARAGIVTVTLNERDGPVAVGVPVRAQAGYRHSAAWDIAEWRDLPSFRLEGLLSNGLDYRAFEVSGDSMEPTLWNGDWVVCHQLLRPQQVRPMHVHLILTNDSLYIKRVVHQPEHHALILLSDNEFYPPTTTPEADVLELWVADAVISKRLGSPQQTRLFQNIAQSLASIQAHLALVPPPAH